MYYSHHLFHSELATSSCSNTWVQLQQQQQQTAAGQNASGVGDVQQQSNSSSNSSSVSDCQRECVRAADCCSVYWDEAQQLCFTENTLCSCSAASAQHDDTCNELLRGIDSCAGMRTVLYDNCILSLSLSGHLKLNFTGNIHYE